MIARWPASSVRLGVASLLFALVVVAPGARATAQSAADDDLDNTKQQRLAFDSLPALPDPIGVAGPVAGVHNEALIVAGGAQFGRPSDPELWNLPKRYLTRVWILRKQDDADAYQWLAQADQYELRQPIGYAAVVSTEYGVLCMGGQNETGLQRQVFLLRWVPASQAAASESLATNRDADTNQTGNDFELIQDDQLPALPAPATAGGAAIVGNYVYLVAGEISDVEDERSASRLVWRLSLDAINPATRSEDDAWERVASWPVEGSPRMYPMVAAQHDGFRTRLYVMGGRKYRASEERTDENLVFLRDCWSLDPQQFDPAKLDPATGDYNGASPWRRQTDAPVPMSAGTAAPLGPAHILVPAYATGEALKDFLDSGQAMRDYPHPGFPETAFAYHTLTDTWIEMGQTPSAQVTTPAVVWDDALFLISGEVRPRVRTRDCWRIRVREPDATFGMVNMGVLVVYLLGMLGVGAYFTFRNKNTDDYFRGGKQMPWWVAGCSIFATMLSSITYMAIPAKAFAQDWTYLVGNFMILAVAPIAILVALPFFRQIDATSAYEYLEKRFNRAIRLIGSGCFTLFHVFRMGVVMALAALALTSVTPLNPTQCVLVMGALSIIYCTLGGIEAVVWTDTIQTIILMGGAVLCLGFAWSGAAPGSWEAAWSSGKVHMVNLDFGPASFATMAIWVVVLGGLGQNIASYTADQAVVQRYMTTSDRRQAARSIWLNGLLSVPASLLFFGLGTAFWMFYRSQPELLEPTMATDRIMPLFIRQQLPIGLAGLVVAGIFAAAQSTVSTSMNSGATTVVTDFLRPLGTSRTERGYLWWARGITLAMGAAGTAAGLLFVDPQIKSLFDEFITVLGMFLGMLAGLFALGATTHHASSLGSLLGAVIAITVLTLIYLAGQGQSIAGIDCRTIIESVVGAPLYRVHPYLYGFIGIALCYGLGWVASWILPREDKNIDGLTLRTLRRSNV